MDEHRSLSVVGDDGRRRCWWCGDDPQYVAYHDEEWGCLGTSDQSLFEKISLEGFQAGLSWLTILRKREAFRHVFKDFDYQKVAKFNSRSVDRLLLDAGIVRHRGKIQSVINNAARALELEREFGSLTDFFGRYYSQTRNFAGVQAKTAESVALSKDLKARGWTFVGPTTAYAFMQSVGLVNDHVPDCFVRASVETTRRKAWGGL